LVKIKENWDFGIEKTFPRTRASESTVRDRKSAQNTSPLSRGNRENAGISAQNAESHPKQAHLRSFWEEKIKTHRAVYGLELSFPRLSSLVTVAASYAFQGMAWHRK
jgi:hypothetical protein